MLAGGERRYRNANQYEASRTMKVLCKHDILLLFGLSALSAALKPSLPETGESVKVN
jgi:hypothetical protein